MRIADNQVIAGLPAITARQMMRRLGEYITPSLVQQIIGCRLHRAAAIVAQLESEGYIAAVGSYWEPTVKGCALCGAKASGRASNTIVCPSGDHFGLPATPPAKFVRATGFEPSASATQIWRTPLRLEVKAMRFPSCEYAGEASKRVEDRNLPALPAELPPAGSGIRHML